MWVARCGVPWLSPAIVNVAITLYIIQVCLYHAGTKMCFYEDGINTIMKIKLATSYWSGSWWVKCQPDSNAHL